MSQISVEKWNTGTDGALNEANMKKKLEKLGFKFEIATYGPGTEFPDHAHGETKRDCVLTGHFEVKVSGQTVVLEPGDMVEVPKDTMHSAKVVGNDKVVLFDAEKK